MSRRRTARGSAPSARAFAAKASHVSAGSVRGTEIVNTIRSGVGIGHGLQGGKPSARLRAENVREWLKGNGAVVGVDGDTVGFRRHLQLLGGG
jgi:hypothetical protein